MIDLQRRDMFDRAQGSIIGAAYGDALGWPNERIHRTRSEERKTNGSLSELKKWTRRSGGRYYPHNQIIDAGTYSDDTQLILSLTRALSRGQQWWEWFCHIELPFWTLYEKGGGRATKRAAKGWTDGHSPWSDIRRVSDVERYFEAGGNGVAMRILPHILFNADSDTYLPIAQNILLDGIATHGHPRALVGALCYGYSLWKSIRRTEPLKYGELIDDLLSNSEAWGTLPSNNPISSEWLYIAHQHVSDYQELWINTVHELTSYLSICQAGISRGSLTLDNEILRSLHCYDPKMSGAGTVAAAAAVYLASRYAPDPINGVISAAYAVGTDTDTIASMTGGLLGTISGIQWLSPLKTAVQDSEYLQKMAKALVMKDTVIESPDIPRLGIRSHLKKFKYDLFKVNSDQSFGLPDGRRGKITSTDEVIGKTKKFKALYFKIEVDGGQSIEISKIVKGSFAEKQPPENIETTGLSKNPLNFGIKLPTHELKDAIWFYEDLLGLEITKRTNNIVVFRQGLSLIPETDYSKLEYAGMDICALVYIEVTDMEQIFSTANDRGINILTSLSLWGKTNRSFFRCNDPDGNIVEVFSINDPSKISTYAVE